ncbi:APC membrane recruitment protein 3 [Salminus brasiliensis]|uniref:APC membrane recruitment protein 3 n=1 Tax=Salminus brasiliensis TaxID=930266 RepID=UPI003B82F071
MELPKSQKQPQGGRTSPKTEPGKSEIQSDSRHEPLVPPDHNRVVVSPGTLPATDTLDTPSPELGAGPESRTPTCSTVKKSRTHDCVVERAVIPGYTDGVWTPTTHHRHRLVNSASFCGFGSAHMVLRENQNTPGGTREILDYRNLTPQVPFVPSIAKSIPKKRVFLRKPKKTIKDFFVQKKQSDEKALSPCTPSERGSTSKRTRRPSRRRNQSRTSHEMTDMLTSDSSSECSADVCEDSVSLKSFGSQAGCGEIFVDEEYLVSLEATPRIEASRDASGTPRPSPTTAAFQGGKEQLASPAQPEVLDLFGMWETFNRTILVGQNSSCDSKTTPTPASVSPSTNESASPLDNRSYPDANIMNTNMETPKSENQESTSDEGYCEDHTRSSLTPVHSGKFPRDTYSGDALYELFYDPSEAEMTPIFDDEMDLTHSIIGQSSDLPLSMYSFHVGAEENLAPPLAVDFISHELLQSNWAGKDCLLKLCDTEISLAMGIVSWLKQKTLRGVPAELGSPTTSTGDKGDTWEEGKFQSAGTTNVPRGLGLRPSNSREDMADFPSRETCQVDPGPDLSVGSPKQHDGVISTVATPESLPRTPASHVCFRIFNINSPLTPTRDLQSPMARSPGSGTSSLFVLAVNKESLCESCKASLKQGAKELHLCHSCTSFIERIKTSELWARATLQQSKPAGTPQPLKAGLLPSPGSSCGVASDISLLSLVEQCASQVSSLRINTCPHLSEFESRAIAESAKDTQPRKDPAKKYLKPKHKKKGKASARVGLYLGDYPNIKNGVNHEAHSPSVLEAEGLGLVTTNESDDLVLESYRSLCYPLTHTLNATDLSPASRPTSLPLSNAACSEFSRKEHHKVKETPHERSRRHRKPAANRDGLSDNVFPEEKKVERKRRMKK